MPAMSLRSDNDPSSASNGVTPIVAIKGSINAITDKVMQLKAQLKAKIIVPKQLAVQLAVAFIIISIVAGNYSSIYSSTASCIYSNIIYLSGFIKSLCKYFLITITIISATLTATLCTLSLYFSIQSRFKKTYKATKKTARRAMGYEPLHTRIDDLLTAAASNAADASPLSHPTTTPAHLQSSHHYMSLHYSTTLPLPLRHELSKLTDLILRDYVLHWFRPMTVPVLDCTFPNGVNEVRMATA